MRNVTCIGDIHGDMETYQLITKTHPWTLQCGDFGVGFVSHPFEVPWYGENHRAFRGNHDNPETAKEHPIFLPDFGVWNDIFYVSGADSIDKGSRTIGISWWTEEELTVSQFNEAIQLYSEVQPNFMASHDCPHFMADDLLPGISRCRTRQALQAMWEIHHPKVWVFAHHHRSIKREVEGCFLRGLGINETFTLHLPDKDD